MNMNETAVMPSSATLPQQMPSVTSSNNNHLNQSTPPELETPTDPNKIRHRVSVRHQVYAQLKEESKRLGKPVVEIATAAIEEYLNKLKAEHPTE
jgi:sulfite reductase (ferredoxin)